MGSLKLFGWTGEPGKELDMTWVPYHTCTHWGDDLNGIPWRGKRCQPGDFLTWDECSRQRKQVWEPQSGRKQSKYTKQKEQCGQNVVCEGGSMIQNITLNPYRQIKYVPNTVHSILNGKFKGDYHNWTLSSKIRKWRIREVINFLNKVYSTYLVPALINVMHFSLRSIEDEKRETLMYLVTYL